MKKNNELDWLNQPDQEINKSFFIVLGAVGGSQGVILILLREPFWVGLIILSSLVGMIGMFLLGKLSGLKNTVPKRIVAYELLFTNIEKQEKVPWRKTP